MQPFLVSDPVHSPYPTQSALPCVLPLHRLITPGVSYALFQSQSFYHSVQMQTLAMNKWWTSSTGLGLVIPDFSSPVREHSVLPTAPRCCEDTAHPLCMSLSPDSGLIRGGKHSSAEGSSLWSESKSYKSHSSAGTNTTQKTRTCLC